MTYELDVWQTTVFLVDLGQIRMSNSQIKRLTSLIGENSQKENHFILSRSSETIKLANDGAH